MNKYKIDHYGGNALVIHNNKDTAYLISYDSVVAKLVKGYDLTLGSDWNHSMTTKRQLFRFLTEFMDKQVYAGLVKNYRSLGVALKHAIENKALKVEELELNFGK